MHRLKFLPLGYIAVFPDVGAIVRCVVRNDNTVKFTIS